MSKTISSIKIITHEYLFMAEMEANKWMEENSIEAINISIATEVYTGSKVYIKYIILIHYVA